ncbi:MAG: hypothetical protein U9R27_06785 [Campylobacterota bacterium]|nr:hypothetical protein [Campylobacterota bacterium]
MPRRPRVEEMHFIKSADTCASRNSAIIRALADGYGQTEVAKYLGISAALVSYVCRSINSD